MVQTRGMEKQLFSKELIPREIAETLPRGYTLRPLQSGDYDRGVLQVLEVLTTVGNISKEKYLGINRLLLTRLNWPLVSSFEFVSLLRVLFGLCCGWTDGRTIRVAS